jgi:hypothetical protein
MKSLYKFLGIAALVMAVVFSFAACNNSTSNTDTTVSARYDLTDGRVTITGLTDHPGKYVYGAGVDTGRNLVLAAYDEVSSTQIKLGKINDSGSVTLKVWKYMSSKEAKGYFDFTGDFSGEFIIGIIDKNQAVYKHNEKLTPDAAKGIGKSITFAGGTAAELKKTSYDTTKKEYTLTQ